VLPLINGTLVDVRHLPVSGSEGELEVVAPYSFQGSIALYRFGHYHSGYPNYSNDVTRVSVTSDTDSTNLGTFGGNTGGSTNHSNEAGYQQSGSPNNASTRKFNFASETPGTEVYNSLLYSWSGGASTTGYGYFSNHINNFKFPFASITPVINTGSLPSSRERGPAVNASLTHGYYSGGGTGSGGNTGVDTILKYPFASDTDVTDVAELQNNRRKEAGGSSSETHGYVMGGEAPNSYSTSVEKFPFSSDSPSTNIISSGFTRDGTAGSSTTHGYLLGGKDGNYLTANIKKHSFTNDSEVTTVGSLSVASSGALDASSHCANN
jgi:hypothetical protein